jgi:predicted phage terminase large subunit-like protein
MSLEFLRRTVTENPYIAHTPHPKQALFLSLTGIEALYGGAAGGGKSDGLLMAALQFAPLPNYSALLLRRTRPELLGADGLITRSFSWLADTDAKWLPSQWTWQFPKGGRLEFGFMDDPQDHARYKGQAYHYIGWDELTAFRESDYTFMFSRLRKGTGDQIPLRIRAGSNPGGIGHAWVKKKFVSCRGVGDRTFIPARLEDNPSLGDEYRASLAQLDHITRRQLEHGDWEVTQGGLLFKRQWFDVVDQRPAHVVQRVRYWDLAATKPKKGTDPDWTSGTLMSRTPDGLFFIEDVRRVRETPLEVENLIKQTARLDGTSVVVAMEQEPGAGGIFTMDHFQRTVLQGYGFDRDKVITNKAARAKPLSSAAEGGYVKMVRGDWNEPFLDQAELFPQGDHDDQVDSASGAHQRLTNQKAFLFTA